MLPAAFQTLPFDHLHLEIFQLRFLLHLVQALLEAPINLLPFGKVFQLLMTQGLEGKQVSKVLDD